MSQNKQSQYSLLIGPYVRKNQQKYAKDAKTLAKFDGITLDDLKITNVQKQADGVRVAQIDSTTKDFTAAGQKWKCVNVHDSKVLTATDDTALTDKAEAEQQSTPGVYVYGSGADAKFIVVISDGTAAEQAGDVATGMLIDALNYDVASDDITADANEITVDGDTIYGKVEFVTGKAATTVLTPDDEPTDLNE